MRWRTWAGPAVCMTIVCGCGSSGSGSGSDVAQIGGAMRAYTTALASHNGEAACAEMVPGLQRQLGAVIVSISRQEGAPVGLYQGKPCGALLDLVTRASTTKNVFAQLHKLRFVDIRVHGNHAVMDGQFPTSGGTVSQPYYAEKLDGHWLLSCCLGKGALPSQTRGSAGSATSTGPTASNAPATAGPAVSAGSYVKALCSTLGPFLKDIRARSVALTQVSPIASVAQRKATLQGFFAGVVRDGERALSRLRAAGSPNVQSGSEIESSMVVVFTRFGAAVKQASREADGLPDHDLKAFGAEASALNGAFTKAMSGIGSGIGNINSPELASAEREQPACKSIGA